MDIFYYLLCRRLRTNYDIIGLPNWSCSVANIKDSHENYPSANKKEEVVYNRKTEITTSHSLVINIDTQLETNYERRYMEIDDFSEKLKRNIEKFN